MPNENLHAIDHNGEKVFFSVSPCSWMHRGYGLQVKVSLIENGCNAESEFILDKAFDAMEKPKQALDDAAKVMVEKWLAENGTSGLHASVAKWKAAREKFAADAAEEAEAEKKTDAEHKAKGYTHRIDAWIHPAHGDDYQAAAYVVGAPTKKDIADILRSSTVKNDFKVTEL